MRKKTVKKAAWGFSSSPLSVHEYLKECDRYIIKKQWSKAQEKLEEIEKRFSGNQQIFQYWLTLAHEQNDWKTYQKKAEEYILKYPDEPKIYLALSDIRLKNNYLILALEVLEDFCAKFPQHPEITEAKEKIETLQTAIPQLLKEYKLEEKKALEIGKLSEQSRFLFETGQHSEARKILENLLEIAPSFPPPINNLSMILCAEGNLTQAIALAKKVLQQNQDNFQALSNLVRFYVLSGETELAKKYLKKLKELTSEISDIWLKKAEALSFFEDNEGLIKLGQEAELSEDSEDLTGLFWHWVAVAYANLGQENKARQLWQKALKISPYLEQAKQNLDNIKLSVGERNTPWAFDLQDWIPSVVIKDLARIIEDDSEDNKKGKSIATQIIQKYPSIITIIPILLKRGSPLARQFALMMIASAKTPELVATLKEFAFGTEGTDKQRMEAVQQMNQEGLIPSGNVKIWIKGQQQEILLMGMEINDDPTVIHSKKVQKLGERAVMALKIGEAEKGESILLEALKLEPSAPDLKFNLANAYMAQDREEEALELLKKVHQEHPDYAFAAISLARLHLKKNEIEAAETFLKPLLKKKQFNYQEFSKFCETQIHLAVKKKTPEAAQSWLGLWKQIGDEDEPSLKYWSNRLENKSSWFLK